MTLEAWHGPLGQESDQSSAEKLYEGLSADEQAACREIRSTPRRYGVRPERFESLGLTAALENLIARGIVQRGTDVQFAQEWLSQHADDIAKFESEVDVTTDRLTNEEFAFHFSITLCRRAVTAEHTAEVRVRLSSESFQEFLRQKNG